MCRSEFVSQKFRVQFVRMSLLSVWHLVQKKLINYKVQYRTCFEEIHLVNSILKLKLPYNGFEIKPKYYSFKRLSSF